MFIVIEGPDGSGKSSLVDEIARQAAARFPEHEVVRFHMGRPEVESREWCLSRWATDIESRNWTDRVIAIADRWHWGEVTYAPLKRPHTCKDQYGLLGVSGWRFVELALLSRGVTQFALMQPLDVIQRRVSARGDDFVDVAELERIHKLYTFGIEHAARIEVLTPPEDSVELLPALAQDVIRTAQEQSRSAELVSQFPEYVGAPRPRVLLVGDKRNRKDVTVMPFYPIHGNSGEYLLSCLPDPFWKTVGIVNGSEACGGRLLLLWEALGRPRVVALGRLAEKSIRVDAIPRDMVNVVPHPQYVRRFHHHDRFEYGLAIERLSHRTEEDRWILR